MRSNETGAYSDTIGLRSNKRNAPNVLREREDVIMILEEDNSLLFHLVENCSRSWGAYGGVPVGVRIRVCAIE